MKIILFLMIPIATLYAEEDPLTPSRQYMDECDAIRYRGRDDYSMTRPSKDPDPVDSIQWYENE